MGAMGATAHANAGVQETSVSRHHRGPITWTPDSETPLTITALSSDHGSGRRPLFQLKATLPACAYIRGAEWPIFVITFWVVTVTVARPNLVYA